MLGVLRCAVPCCAAPQEVLDVALFRVPYRLDRFGRAHVTAPARRTDRALLAFFMLAFAISWGALGGLHAIATASDLGTWQDLTRSAETRFDLASLAGSLVVPAWLVRALTIVADFGPSLAAVVVAVVTGRWRMLAARLTRWRVGGRWYLIVFGLPVAVMSSAIALTVLTGTDLSPVHWGAGTAAALLGWLALRTLLGGGLGEELGWRGWALPRLQARMSPVTAAALLGIVWAAWHLPLVLIADAPLVQAAVLLLFIAPMAFLYSWVFNGTGGSVLLVVLLHGAQNGFSAFFEQSLLPALADADMWVVLRVLLLLGVAVGSAVAVRRQGTKGTVVRDEVA